jgi:membrane-associated phospholipid phosphatase
MKFLADFCKKYKHGFVMAAYTCFYLIMFYFIEHRDVRVFHVVHTVFDDMIPFCEYFIVPYLLWFPYMVLTVLYFIFINKDKREYYQLALNMMMGMTLFLVVSYVYPNIQHLRPTEFPRDNIFTDLVKMIYRFDTPTNILPSIHVFNSLAIHMSLTNCAALRNKKGVRIASLILTLLIISSTMFLKQHSVIDVCLGATLALFGYLLFYPQQAHDARHAKALPAGEQEEHKFRKSM